MNTNYSKYLIYLCLVIIFFCLIWVITKRKKKMGQKENKKEIKPITSGSISVFFDKGENVVILTLATDLYGMGKVSGAPVFLNTPYTDEQLGEAISLAMSAGDKGLPCSDSELMNRLGAKGWKEFSQGKRSISVHYREGHGVVLNSTVRKPDGAYQFTVAGFEKIVSPNVTDNDLGRAVKEILRKCRC
jgi:hypothetical protein